MEIGTKIFETNLYTTMIDPQLRQYLAIFVAELEKNSAGNGKRASKRTSA